MFKELFDCFPDIVESYDGSTVVFKNSHSLKFTLRLKVEDTNLQIESVDTDTNSVMLVGVLKHKNYNNINSVFDMLSFIQEELDNITNYCVGCCNKLDFQSDTITNCGTDACVYKFEELIIGDPVMTQYRADLEIFRLLVQSSFDAITCSRKLDVFEPFPTTFLKDPPNNLKIPRGEVSKLVGQNFDQYKDFDRLNSVITGHTLDQLITKLDLCTTDKDVINVLNKDTYTLLRFVIMSNVVQIMPDKQTEDPPKGCLVYNILQPADKETEFEQLKKAKVTSHYLFHGSNISNWYSILRNGVKNCSKSKLMTAGAAFGNGVYLSSDANYSYQYGSSGNRSFVAVFEVLGPLNTYLKGGSIHVVEDDKMLIQRKLLIFSNRTGLAKINSMFNKDIYQQVAKTNALVQNKGVKKLIKEYKILAKSLSKDPDSLGFRMEVDFDNSYLWNVFINKYDPKEPVGRDMELYGIKEIQLELRFPNSYPFNPPFVRIVRPRFKQLTGHVTSGGSICSELLTNKHWVPTFSIESLIINIKTDILEGGGRIDPAKWNQGYDLREAQESFQRVAKAHGWN